MNGATAPPLETLSVIITCYNLESYIGAAVESVLAQDDPGPVEIIVVDDCSSDQSASIVERYKAVRLMRMPENSGVLLAMLAGIEAARGDIVALLDGDDLWEPGKLKAVRRRFEEDPDLAFLTHDLSFIDASGTVLDRRSRPGQELDSMPAAGLDEALREGILDLCDYIWLGSAMAIRRSTSRFDKFASWARSLPDPRNTYQDWTFAYWIAAQADARLGYIPEKLFRYRLHHANHSGDARTAERGLRNLRRGRNTKKAMLQIAHMKSVPQRFVRRLIGRIAAHDYLIELQQGRRWSALTGFPKSVRDFAARGILAKEIVRFVGIQLLGPDRFSSIVHRGRPVR